jgi:hypothetical protein
MEADMRLRALSIVRVFSCCMAAAIALASHMTPARAWDAAHGGRDNSGLAGVVTAPAGKGSLSVPGLGKFAPGAGPVVASDGTVYLGTVEGKLIALHADGSPFWSRDITRGQNIVASPLISSDGSIYVIGVKIPRENAPDARVPSATLHHFNNSGAWVNQIAFPQHGEVGPVAFSPPNLWRDASGEAIMVPAVYRNKVTGGYAVRLIAFSLTGQVLDDKVVKNITPQTVGGSNFPMGCVALLAGSPILGPLECMIAYGTGYNPKRVPNFLVRVPPAPGAAITFADNGTPFILVSDHYKDLVGFVFSEQHLVEIFRVQETSFVMRTPPMVMPDRSTLIGVESLSRPDNELEEANGRGRIIVVGRGGTKTGQVDLKVTTQAAPTRMADGRVAVVGGDGNVVILKDGAISGGMQGAGRSIASAAASLSHVFVAGEDGFVTYDTNSLAEVRRFDWVGGGLNPPVIGPKGHVYAIASNILFVFPPPKLGGVSTIRTPQSGVTVATNPDPATTMPQEKTYGPPMTAGGNRLFACEELDQDDCGKGDHKDISLAWCQKEGYPQVKDYDVDSKKVKAETLDGRFCSKNKCKVFDQIVCSN